MIASLFIIIIPIPPSLYSRSLPLYFKRHRGHRVLTNRSLDDHESRCSRALGGTVSEHRICNRLLILLNRIYPLSVTTLYHAVRATARSPQMPMIGARLVASCIAFHCTLYSVCRIG